MKKFIIITTAFFAFLLMIFVFSWLPSEVFANHKPGHEGGGGTPAWNQQKFLFRDDDGTEISATGFGAENVNQNVNITNVAPETNFRLRFAVKLTVDDEGIEPRLEFKEGTDCTTGVWNTITSSSSNFNLQLSDNFVDGVSTTQQLVGGPNFVAGQILKSTNPAPDIGMLKNQSTEYEWSLKVANNINLGTTHSFRITNNGTALNTYDQCPSLTIQAASSAPSGGGGGGGSGGGTRPTAITFSGRAYPGAEVVIIAKDPIRELPVKSDIVVSPNGDFVINFGGVVSDVQSYGLAIKDKEKRATQSKFYNLNPKFEPIIEKDIFAPPTIGFVRSTVTKGDLLTVTGYATPGSFVETEVDGELITKQTEVGPDGSYKVFLNTGALDFDAHTIKSRQKDKSGAKSDFSPQKTFIVSKLFTPKTDLNNDGIINVSDFSIFLARWQSKDASLKKLNDLNDDGKVDIKDFSIFIRTIKK